MTTTKTINQTNHASQSVPNASWSSSRGSAACSISKGQIMTMYSEAVKAVSRIVAQTESKLAAEFRVARHANISATKEAILDLLPADDPMYPVTELIAHTLTIGRASDDFPHRSVPVDTQNVFAEAIRAEGHNHLPDPIDRVSGLLKILGGHANSVPSINLESLTRTEHNADYDAWDKLKKYRNSCHPKNL